MAEPTKAELDEMNDRARDIIREGNLGSLERQYAATVARALATQFPDVPELPRIALACAQHMSALAAEGVRNVTIVHILGGAGLQLEEHGG